MKKKAGYTVYIFRQYNKFSNFFYVIFFAKHFSLASEKRISEVFL